jgi:hypothetical protein
MICDTRWRRNLPATSSCTAAARRPCGDDGTVAGVEGASCSEEARHDRRAPGVLLRGESCSRCSDHEGGGGELASGRAAAGRCEGQTASALVTTLRCCGAPARGSCSGGGTGRARSSAAVTMVSVRATERGEQARRRCTVGATPRAADDVF